MVIITECLFFINDVAFKVKRRLFFKLLKNVPNMIGSQDNPDQRTNYALFKKYYLGV